MVLFDSNERAKNGRGGAGRRDSEEVAPGYPVMPIADRFGGGFVRIDGGQLRKRDGHLPPLPPDLHEHIARGSCESLRREPDPSNVWPAQTSRSERRPVLCLSAGHE